MKDNNVVAFYCNNCHKTVLNCEHNFEQLHEKGLCAECLKKQNKPNISKTESVDNYLCKWQKLERWLTDKHNNDNDNSFLYTEILIKMQELEGENAEN